MKAFKVLMMLSLVYACSDDTRVTLHEAHVYKGNLDMHQGDALTRQKNLQHRALQVFTDR